MRTDSNRLSQVVSSKRIRENQIVQRNTILRKEMKRRKLARFVGTLVVIFSAALLFYSCCLVIIRTDLQFERNPELLDYHQRQQESNDE